MKIKYFADTDTALIELNNNKIEETTEINENIYVDLDHAGNVVNITIEHAKASGQAWEFSYQEMQLQHGNKSEEASVS